MVLIEESFVVFTWEEETRTITATWTGKQPSSEKIKEVHNNVLHKVAEKKALNYLSDNRKMPLVNKEVEIWLTQEWLPRLMGAGVKHIASVLPASALSRLTLNSMIKSSKLEEAPLFGSVEEAKSWLKAQA